VILPLPAVFLDGVPDHLSLPEIDLVRNSELHITLLATREAEALAARLPETAWRTAFEAQDWDFQRRDRFDLLREDRPGEPTRYSVIRHLDGPSLNAFRRGLAAMSGVDLPETLPHVTLFTAGHERGIGLSSLADHTRFLLRPLTPDEWP
jgi:hypothetical protein